MLKFHDTFSTPCYYTENYQVAQFRTTGAYYLFNENQVFIATVKKSAGNRWEQLSGKVLSEILIMDIGKFISNKVAKI